MMVVCDMGPLHYSEQTGPSGEALGSFPQTFTHLALISAAFNLDRALAQRHPDH